MQGCQAAHRTLLASKRVIDCQLIELISVSVWNDIVFHRDLLATLEGVWALLELR